MYFILTPIFMYSLLYYPHWYTNCFITCCFISSYIIFPLYDNKKMSHYSKTTLLDFVS